MTKGANSLKLSRYEQETIILYNEAEYTATVETCNDSMIRRLDRLCDLFKSFRRIRSDGVYVKYEIPKNTVGIRAPRIMSDAQRAHMAARAKVNFCRNATKDKT